MNSIAFLPEDAAYLAAKARSAALAAKELVSFWSEEPALAGQAAVEVLALEAKSILSGGSMERVMMASRLGKPVLRQDDLDSVFRLDTLTSLSAARLAGLETAMEGDESDAPMQKLGNIVSIAATMLGIVKTVF
jgi:hypothetical protein